MDGENTVMDFDARTEAAMVEFTAEPETTETATQEGEQRTDGAEGQEQTQDPNAREQATEQATGELTDEQRLADPQYQQLSAFKDEVENVFSEFNIPDAKEAKLQLSDAQVLYQIAGGQAPPSQLLDMFAQNWKPEQVKNVADNLIGWLKDKGYLKDGQAAAAPKQGEPGFKDPLAERLDKFESEAKNREQQEAAKAETVRRETIFKDKYLPAVTNLCNQKGIPAEDHLEYSNAIAAKINGNPAILKRIEAGNTVDVQKFFAEVHNAEVKRLERYNAARMKGQQQKDKNPRIPTGGAPPAPAGSARPTPMARNKAEASEASERRRAVAAEML